MTTATIIKPGQLFIGGKWVDAQSGKTFPTINPATREIITQISEAGPSDVDAAVQAAREAFDSGPWSKLSAMERGRLLWKVGELIMTHADTLAELETMDCGKPISESRNIDIPMVAEIFQYYAGYATKIHGETIPVKGNFLNYTLREPIGVIATITPWNFPLLLAAWKIAPTLACGNTLVHKPSEHTPLTSLKLAEIMQEAGIPDGVFNVVTGDGPTTGAALVKHAGVDKVAFTGGTETGQLIMKMCADSVKKVSLELGGKSPNVVFADADLDAAAKFALIGIFYNKGEVCAAGSRLLVEASVHDALMGKILERVKKMVPGDPMNPKTRFGPVASEEQFNKVRAYIESGKREGAKLVAGGDSPADLKGFYINPTIFDGVTPSMSIAKEEIFGPVLSTLQFGSVDEALEIGNGTMYGLAAAVFTRDIGKAHAFAKKIKAGTVWINTYNMYDAASPFGGFKQSGSGKELGPHAIEQYTQVKSVWVNLE